MAHATPPTGPTRCPRTFGNGGTSQAERPLAALLPEALRLGERTLPQLLAYVAEFSKTVGFYEGGTSHPAAAAPAPPCCCACATRSPPGKRWPLR